MASAPAQVRHLIDRAIRTAVGERKVATLILPSDLQEAESLARQWLRVMPENVRARLSLGDVLLAAKRPAEAEAPLREALEGATELGLSVESKDKGPERGLPYQPWVFRGWVVKRSY